MSSRIYLFIPHYGPFKNYFQYYLNSLKKNTDILTIFLITDNDMSGYHLPENCKLIQISLDEIRVRLQRFLNDEYGVSIPYKDLITFPYKLCDIRPIYSILFEDILVKESVTKDDYVGFGDTDVIYGKISNFIDTSRSFLGLGLNGHLLAVKNTHELKIRYKNIKNYAQILQLNKSRMADESGDYLTPLKELSKRGLYLNIRKDIADIIPYLFIGHFCMHQKRTDVPIHWRKAFEKLKNNNHIFRTVESIEENKHLLGNIVNDLYLVHYVENEGRYLEKRVAFINSKDRLILHFEDGTEVEKLYVHFLRRPMALTFKDASIDFKIKNNSFYNI